MVSLGFRIFRTFFLNSIISLFVVIVCIWFVFESMEDVVMKRAAKDHLQLLRQDHSRRETNLWQTSSFTVFFRPKDSQSQELPDIFQESIRRNTDEFEWQGKMFDLATFHMEEGTYYIAEDVTDFESRENLFGTALAVLCIIVMVLNFLLAVFANRQLIGPLRHLTLQIRKSSPGTQLEPIRIAYKDAELKEIADAFNVFIDEISAFIERERVMISLAGHELKTPIAVISGAIQVIENRNQLGDADRKTLARADLAVREMHENVQALLTLYRHSRVESSRASVALDELLFDLMDETDFLDPSQAQRIKTEISCPDIVINTDAVMAKLLFRNLIRNALRHTHGPVLIRLLPSYLDVLDQGAGLPKNVTQWISERKPERPPSHEGLGLYLVTLASERLGWSLSRVEESDWKNGLRVMFHS